MATRKRIRPSTAGTKASNVQAYSVREFFEEFANDETCLTRVMAVRYGLRHVCEKCGKDATFHKIAGRRAFSCAACGDHVYPLRWHDLSGQPDSPANVVLCDLSLHRDAPRRKRQGASTLTWRHLQDSVAHRPSNPRSYDKSRLLRNAQRSR